MAEKIIMLACSAGMSTSMLVAKMQEEAKNRGKDYEIFAKSVADIDHQFETKKPDVLMLGPQVAYMKADVQKKCDDAGVPMEVINMTDERMQIVMGLIMAGGNAKNCAVEAITAAKKGDFSLAKEKLKDANQAIVDAHNVQTDMLTKEAQGEHTEIDLYMVHAQDHLMTGITFVDLAKEIIAVYKRLDEEGK